MSLYSTTTISSGCSGIVSHAPHAPAATAILARLSGLGEDRSADSPPSQSGAHSMISRSHAALVAVALTIASPAHAQRQATPRTIAQRQTAQPASALPAVDPSLLSDLRYRYIGPVGNRVASVAGVPGDFNTYYAGAASGGIW